MAHRNLLLQHVMESLHSLTSHFWKLRNSMGAGKNDLSPQAMASCSREEQGAGKWDHCSHVIERRLCVTLSRSKEALRDFEEFYCLRLVLDDQSPLASFLIDLFSHLEFLLLQLRLIADRSSWLQPLICRSLQNLQHVTSTCRLLYATCNMLPTTICASQVGTPSAHEEFKRKGQRQGRRFSSNLLHCRMQHMGFVYLDQPGCSRVKLVQELGKGVSSAVYKGIFELPPAEHGHSRTGGLVAVKMFRDGDAAESSAGSSSAILTSNFGSRLLQSMQQMTNWDLICENHDNSILAELEKLVVAKHPNIMTPMGYIGKRTEGECGLVMELMDESLHDYLEKVHNGKVPPLKEVDMLDLMLEIARGMRYLHECELIHLGLKPKNVLLRFSDGMDHPPEVKVADLGLTTLSSFFQKENEDMVPLGTSCYTAPEVRYASSQNAGYDEKVDVFSFGTTCFNILLGNPNACAFSGTISHFYAAIKTGEWKQWVEGCSPFLVKLIGRCWEMEANLRPTFATLCVLLQQAIECYLVSDAGEWFSTSCSWLKIPKDDKKPDRLEVYAAISGYCKRNAGIILDLDIMKRSVLQFESHVGANAKPVLPLMENLSKESHVDDNREDKETKVCTVMEWKRGLQREHSEKPQVHLELTVMERCFDDADPLMLIKRHAYLNLFILGYNPNTWKVGDLSSFIQRNGHAFDFSKDMVNAPLQVDTSLIPLLVSFWRALPFGYELI